MCFSAEASFTSSFVLSGFAVAAYRNLSRRAQILFASIPVIFAFQQFVEGVVWLTLGPVPQYKPVQKIASYLFLVMAQVLWPLFMPLALLLMERGHGRRKIYYGFLALGAVVVAYYGYGIIFGDINLRADKHHIQYQNFSTGANTIVFFALYTLVTIVPLFVSSVKGTAKMGFLMLGSCLVSLIFFVEFLTSVWCFFAAAISFVVYKILKDAQVEYFRHSPGVARNEVQGFPRGGTKG